jgi:hypothetical protein
MLIEPEIRTAINNVLSCDELIDALFEFEKNYDLLKECRFIFFTDKYGADIPHFLKNQKINDFSIHNLASANKMVVVDDMTYKEMMGKGTSTYGIDACIALDTQTVSYLRGIILHEKMSVKLIDSKLLIRLLKKI